MTSGRTYVMSLDIILNTQVEFDLAAKCFKRIWIFHCINDRYLWHKILLIWVGFSCIKPSWLWYREYVKYHTFFTGLLVNLCYLWYYNQMKLSNTTYYFNNFVALKHNPGHQFLSTLFSASPGTAFISLPFFWWLNFCVFGMIVLRNELAKLFSN